MQVKKEGLHNNFTVLRLILTVLVVLSHFKTLPGVAPADGLFGYGDFAVDGFFVISGYLITASYDKQPQLDSFYIRRLFRVYPLYIVTILLQAWVMIALLGGVGWLAGHVGETLRYIALNIAFANFMAYDMGGLLSGLHNPGINPSLWTLKIEMAFYIILPLLWQLTRRYGAGFLIAVYAASTLYTLVALHYGMDSLSRQLPGQMRLLIVGVALYRYRKNLLLPKPAEMALLLAAFILCSFRRELPIMAIYPLLVGAFVFLCAFRLPVLPMRRDISYGVYLFHAPLTQLAVLLGLFADTPFFLLGLLAAVFLLAFIAEIAIERPGIALGHRLASARRKREPAP